MRLLHRSKIREVRIREEEWGNDRKDEDRREQDQADDRESVPHELAGDFAEKGFMIRASRCLVLRQTWQA